MDPRLRPLILASSSPRRRRLLQALGEAFEVIPPLVEETLPAGPLIEAVAELALRKARAVASRVSGATILAADTLVAVGGRVLGKPSDPEDARRMLELLSGSEHKVYTGVALLATVFGLEEAGTETTRIRMRRIRPAELSAYVASGEPMGKAGAYAVQETGDRFVEQILGPYDNVVGLPMGLVEQLLERLARRLPPPG